MEFTQDQVAAMMVELGQNRYVVKRHFADCQGHPAGPYDPMGETVYCDNTCNHDGFVVVDTAHQDRQMSDVMDLLGAKGWAYGEHESWARRALRRKHG
jgi:hypothetical protein